MAKLSTTKLLCLLLLAQVDVLYAQDEDEEDEDGEGEEEEGGDEEDDMAHRSSLTWGRVFIKGGVTHHQYFKARFGEDIPMTSMPFALSEANNADGCRPPTGDVKGKVVFVDRGNCTFATKARFLEKAGAGAVAIVNFANNLTHPPGPDGRDVTIPTVMVTSAFGDYIKVLAERQAIEGRMIPIYCEKESGTSVCLPVAEEEKLAHQVTEGGNLVIDGATRKFEFLTAKFGLPVPTNQLEMVVPEPANGCGEIEGDLTGKAVLVQRGGCTFLDKVLALSEAGAHAVLIANTQPGVLRVDCLKRWDAHGLTSSAMMVSQHAWDELKASVGKQVAFETTDAKAEDWEALKNAVSYEQWPAEDQERNDLFVALSKKYKVHPDRHAYLEDAFAELGPDAEDFLQSLSSGKGEL
jgi:hypothetical protein